jgi:cytochrome c-type biogenesis protein CcsB
MAETYHQLEIELTHAVLAVYAFATVGYLLNVFFRARWLGTLSTIVGWAGLAAHTGAIVFRSLALGRPPFTTGYDFALCFMWGIVAAYLVAEIFIKRSARAEIAEGGGAGSEVPNEAAEGEPRKAYTYARGQLIGAFVFPAACVLWGYAFHTFGTGLDPELMPALKNRFWLYTHVATAILAYGVLFTSFVTAAMYLLRRWADGREWPSWQSVLPSQEWLDRATYAVIAFAFPFLTLVIITGAVWANVAWSRPWGWDPKETGSLIAWLLYLAFLHARLRYGWRGVRTAVFAIVGFSAIIFCWAGVNYLPGLHSYGAPK